MIWAHLPPPIRRLWADEQDFEDTARALARRGAGPGVCVPGPVRTAVGGQGQIHFQNQDEVRS